MSSQIYSNPLVHTAYYSREIFSSSRSYETEALEALFLQAHGFGYGVQHRDFAFNENVNCSNIANGILMRLNACSLLKLQHWCLYPTDSTSTKIVQYLARIFLSPVAALIDLVMNVVLVVFKLSAWPILHVAMDTDEVAKECLYQNISWHCTAVCESFLNLRNAVVGSVFSLAGPCSCFASSWAMELWGYLVTRYEGDDVPLPRRIYESPFAELMAMGEDHDRMSRHYAVWFREGTEEAILDPQRVRYLREHCGWNDVSVEQLKSIGPPFQKFKDTRIAFHLDPNQQRFHLIVDGAHYYTTGSGDRMDYHTNEFIRSIFVPIPPRLPVALDPVVA